MTRINEERFKKVEEILTAKEREFLSQERIPPFSAFVDWETWRAVEGHVRVNRCWGIKNENEIKFIQFRHWKIFWLNQKIDEEKENKIGILMYPCDGSYQSTK